MSQSVARPSGVSAIWKGEMIKGSERGLERVTARGYISLNIPMSFRKFGSLLLSSEIKWLSKSPHRDELQIGMFYVILAR